MDEKDLLIQSLRREIANLTHDIRIKDTLLTGYEKVLKSAILETMRIVDEMSKELKEINEYLSTEIQKETQSAGAEDRQEI